jgi:hypothetical protein
VADFSQLAVKLFPVSFLFLFHPSVIKDITNPMTQKTHIILILAYAFITVIANSYDKDIKPIGAHHAAEILQKTENPDIKMEEPSCDIEHKNQADIEMKNIKTEPVELKYEDCTTHGENIKGKNAMRF